MAASSLSITALSLAACAAAPALQPAEPTTTLTVYSSADPAGFNPQQFISQQRGGWDSSWIWQVPGYAVVKEVRDIDVDAGISEIRFTDVAEFIDPTTVSFLDLTDPDGTRVLEQNFQFDLVSPSKILERYIDHEITIVEETEMGNGATMKSHKPARLLSVNQGQVVLQMEDGLRFLPASDASLRLPALPEGLITRPTLVWKVNARTGGPRLAQTTYQTDGMTWRADYNLILNEDDTAGDLGAWVTLMNVSGASFDHANLKLVAGDVQRIKSDRSRPAVMRGVEGGQFFDETEGFEEKSFFEYHLYTLPRPTDIRSNTTQQITLFPTARGVSTEKVLVYYGFPDSQYYLGSGRAVTDRDLGSDSNKKVDVYIRFENEEENRLGVPLPAGKIRVYKVDEDDTTGRAGGSLEFVGEDVIDHTPRDQEVLIKLGQAFDVVGERKVTNFSVDTNRRVLTETIEVTLSNAKDQPQRVIVRETLYRWTNCEVHNNSDPFEEVDARTIHFPVDVPARGEKKVSFTARYTW